MLARSRNHLLSHALDDEEWVFWVDVDMIDAPADVLERLLATGKEIVQPHCVLVPGGPTFDHNGWRDHGRLHLDDFRGGEDVVQLHAVGGTMLLVRADLHRDGLHFPPSRTASGTRSPGRDEVKWRPRVSGSSRTTWATSAGGCRTSRSATGTTRY